ncbi:hypothetical protein WR25_06535 [Diploscapter pachys]|uniref:Uncharacterized protein n=1 Tax=Diploscapter pachys TaxID=2018661 RepID=A0A2A2K829_9BILA|nr:hypothetical protein WR25_06535 [Diploscapter pachys]
MPTITMGGVSMMVTGSTTSFLFTFEPGQHSSVGVVLYLNITEQRCGKNIENVDKNEAHEDRPSSKTDFVGPPAFGPLGLPTPEFNVPGKGNGIPNTKIIFPQPPPLDASETTTSLPRTTQKGLMTEMHKIRSSGKSVGPGQMDPISVVQSLKHPIELNQMNLMTENKEPHPISGDVKSRINEVSHFLVL